MDYYSIWRHSSLFSRRHLAWTKRNAIHVRACVEKRVFLRHLAILHLNMSAAFRRLIG